MDGTAMENKLTNNIYIRTLDIFNSEVYNRVQKHSNNIPNTKMYTKMIHWCGNINIYIIPHQCTKNVYILECNVLI